MTTDLNDKTNIPVKTPVIGLLAVKNFLITKEDLQKGLSQGSSAQDPTLALQEYLLSEELVSPENMQRLVRAAKALDTRQKEFKFGAIAVRKGFINQSVLKLALEEQAADIRNKRKIRMLGDLLVDAGMLTPKQCDYILKLQKRVRQEAEKTLMEKGGNPALGEGETPSGNPEGPSDLSPAGSKALSDTGMDDLLEPEMIAGGIKLEITKDFMAAFLTKTDDFDDNITVTEVKEALFENGILLGIADDKMIEGFIRSSGFKTKSFQVAKGIFPVQGRDARVEFFFNTDYLKAGGLTTDGSIDFKDRGEIPHVEEGTVLAEKLPMLESRLGHNIYGDEIDAVPGTDLALKIGKGAKLSEDGFKVLADVRGIPKYALSGHIFVHQEYVTGGDVDFETGHIKFDGNVNVQGRIKSGFKVNGNDIRAVELDGGTIDAQGDVRIAGGINEGKIYSRGNVFAKFIHNSEIMCMGNVVVEKEIVDSDVDCSGACVTENGKLISSRISSKMGVKAKNIGTERVRPNVIHVGRDAFSEKELEKNKADLDQLKVQIEKHLDAKEILKQENLELQKQITALAHIQDRSQLEQKEIASTIASLNINGETSPPIKDLEEKIQELKLQAQDAEQSLDENFDKCEKIEDMIQARDRKIQALETTRDDLLAERNNLIAWSKDNPGKPVVIVTGAVLPETHIRGRHSEMRVGELIRHARITEILCTSDDGQSLNVYEMRVDSI